jgi:hypothetical protein
MGRAIGRACGVVFHHVGPGQVILSGALWRELMRHLVGTTLAILARLISILSLCLFCHVGHLRAFTDAGR